MDAFAVLLRATPATPAGWTEAGRTETVWGESSPAFVRAFAVRDDDCSLGCDLRVAVYAKTGRSEELRKNGFLGYAEFTAGRALEKVDGVIERVLRGRDGRNDGRGVVSVVAERVVEENGHGVSIQMGFAYNSKAWGEKGGKRARKAFYVIYRAILNGAADTDWLPVYRSEVVDPYKHRAGGILFESASLRAETLFGSDENRGLRIEMFHYSGSGPHVALGFVQTSFAAFRFAKPGGRMFVVPAEGGGVRRAEVILETAKIGLTTRRGDINSVFCLKAEGFVWGGCDDGGDDYLERDAFGRTGIDVFIGQEGRLPRGVSYMAKRKRGEVA